MRNSKIIKLLTGKGHIKEQLKFSNIICGILAFIATLVFVLIIFDIGVFGEISEKSKNIYNLIVVEYFVIFVVKILKNTRIMKNEDMLKSKEIALKDERNINNQKRALSCAVYAYIGIGFIVGLIILPFYYESAITIFYTICALLALYCIMFCIFYKTM